MCVFNTTYRYIVSKIPRDHPCITFQVTKYKSNSYFYQKKFIKRLRDELSRRFQVFIAIFLEHMKSIPRSWTKHLFLVLSAFDFLSNKLRHTTFVGVDHKKTNYKTSQVIVKKNTTQVKLRRRICRLMPGASHSSNSVVIIDHAKDHTQSDTQCRLPRVPRRNRFHCHMHIQLAPHNNSSYTKPPCTEGHPWKSITGAASCCIVQQVVSRGKTQKLKITPYLRN